MHKGEQSPLFFIYYLFNSNICYLFHTVLYSTKNKDRSCSAQFIILGPAPTAFKGTTHMYKVKHACRGMSALEYFSLS